MKVKLFDLAKELEVGVATLNEFLVAKKVIETPSNNPNARIDVKEYKMIMGEFGSSLSASRREEIEQKLFPAPRNSKSKPSSPKTSQVKDPSPAKPASKEEKVEEKEEQPIKIQVKGHIDLSKPSASLKKKDTPSPKIQQEEAKSAKKEDTKVEVKQEVTSEKLPHEEKSPAQDKQKPTATVEVTKVSSEKRPPISERKEESAQTQANQTVSSAKSSNEVVPKGKDKPSAAPQHKVVSKGVDATSVAKTKREPSMKSEVKVASDDKKQTETAEQVPTTKTKENQSISSQKVQNDNSVKHHAEPSPKVASKEEPSEAIAEKQHEGVKTESTPEEPEKKEPEIFRLGLTEAPKFQVKGKIDLSAIEPSKAKKTKRSRRKRISTSAVDIKAEASKGVNSNAGKNKSTRGEAVQGNSKSGRNANRSSNASQQQSQQLGRKAKRNAKKSNANQRQEVSSEDIERKVKEVQARIAAGKRQSFGRSENRRRRDLAKRQAERDAQSQLEEAKVIKITEYVTVSDLANLMGVPVNEVIATCMSIDMMVSINMRLDSDTITLIAEEFGFETEFVSADVVEAIAETKEEDDEADLVERPPVVTVMGHVDHGKTSLLDHIRNTNVIAGEAGGITQHIGAYSVTLKSGRKVTFLDTPGHQAFTAMRARGAKATDIAIIIIDATSHVMPQTKEALNHASAAGVPIVFAINKIDKPTANPNQIKEQLAQLNYLVEDWGGKYQCQEISAKKGDGVRELLDKVLLEADILELKANPNREASGLIIESSLDKGRGYVAQILVSNGTLHVGDMVLAGKYCGRVRALTNERGQNMESADPSTPATLLGLDGAPTAGDTFNVLENEQEARNIARRRRQLDREQDIRTQHRLTLDQIGQRIKIGNFKELNLIIKGDVDGSIEALSDSLIKLSTPEIEVKVIHKAVGQISENDVDLAKASEAVIIGFQVRPNATARKLSEQYGVEIRTYSIIYDAIDDVKSAMEGMLAPEIREQVTATLEVLQVFNIKGVGTIAGCMVKEGKIKRTDKVRVIRDGIVLHTDELASLKRYKDDAKEVVTGLECGLSVKNYDDIQVGDILESFTEIELKKKL